MEENFLKNISKQNPFEAPEGYFSSMEESLRSSVLGHKESFFVKVFKTAISLAASFVFIFVIGFGVLKLTNPVNVSPTYQEAVDLAAELDCVNPSVFEYMTEEDFAEYDTELSIDDVLEYFDSMESARSYFYHYLATLK